MILTGNEDLRVIKTIESIKEAFHTLLCEKDYNRIRVSELCQMARINKKTFYRYYRSLDDLLAEMQKEVSSGFTKRIEGCRLPEDIEKVNEVFFQYSIEQDEAYQKITCCAGVSDLQRIRDGMIDIVSDFGWSDSSISQSMSKTERALLQSFINGAVLGVYRQWLEQGKPMPVEQVIEQVNLLTMHGVQAFIEKIGSEQKRNRTEKGAENEKKKTQKH